MTRKAPKCSKGFPCGKTCISRLNNCFANLSTKDNRMAETFSQFVNRLVGIGNDTRSAIKNESPFDTATAIDNNIKTQERANEILTEITPKIEAGEKVTDILNKLRPEIKAGRKATDLLNNIAKPVSVEVLDAENPITKIPLLLKPGQDVDIDAETIKDEIKSAEKVMDVLETIEIESIDPEDVIEVVEKINTEIKAGEKATEILNNLKPEIKAGKDVTEILNNLKPEIKAGKDIIEILNNLVPPKEEVSSQLPIGITEPSDYQIERLEYFFATSKYWRERLEKVKTEFPELDEREAMGIALWISNEYVGMNNKLWTDLSDDKREELGNDYIEAKYFAANYYAYNAIISGKLPGYNRSQMEKDIIEKNKSLPKVEQLTINPKNILSRGLINLDEDIIKDIRKYYSDNVGKTVKEKTFFATTGLVTENLGFTRQADILFEVIPNKNSKGVMVDKGKGVLYEGEVLFAPGTSFKVLGVEDTIVSNNPDVSMDYINNLSNGKLHQEIKQILSSLDLLDFNIVDIMHKFILKRDMPFNDIKEYLLKVFNKLTPELVDKIYDLKGSITKEDIENMEYITKNGGLNITPSFKIILEEI